jgi:hypothetical protein
MVKTIQPMVQTHGGEGQPRHCTLRAAVGHLQRTEMGRSASLRQQSRLNNDFWRPTTTSLAVLAKGIRAGLCQSALLDGV